MKKRRGEEGGGEGCGGDDDVLDVGFVCLFFFSLFLFVQVASEMEKKGEEERSIRRKRRKKKGIEVCGIFSSFANKPLIVSISRKLTPSLTFISHNSRKHDNYILVTKFCDLNHNQTNI